jgi:topoisomerase-4 subunit B
LPWPSASIRRQHLNGLRYGKICILADADSDGAHIATLLCALFLRISNHWLKQGRVSWPCRRSTASMAKDVHYALDEDEKEAVLKRRHGKKNPSRSTFSGSRDWAK